MNEWAGIYPETTSCARDGGKTRGIIKSMSAERGRSLESGLYRELFSQASRSSPPTHWICKLQEMVTGMLSLPWPPGMSRGCHSTCWVLSGDGAGEQIPGGITAGSRGLALPFLSHHPCTNIRAEAPQRNGVVPMDVRIFPQIQQQEHGTG